ncbi:MAG: acetoacetate--CoA ligase, partial [Actinomycetota bacterium]|nr:acetoacetate--CoA ligase [Actinomycetota bacterium]
MQPLWTPSPDRLASTRMESFRQTVATDVPEVIDSAALHAWSVREPAEFWRRLWAYAGVIGDPGDIVFDAGDGSVRGGRFFPNSSVSYAEN